MLEVPEQTGRGIGRELQLDADEGLLLRKQKAHNVTGPILDGPEVGAVAPALPDVERGLAEIALAWVQLIEIGKVVDPAGLRTGAYIDGGPLNREQIDDRILSALEDSESTGCRWRR